MLDAVVLIHALGVAMGRITSSSAYWKDAAASHDLVEHADALALSAVNWYEVMRGMDKAQTAAIKNWGFDILPVDARVAQRAAKLYQAARSSPKFCPRCLGPVKAVACTGCGNIRAEAQRSNDIVMVATADAASDVRTLYTWDGGVIALGHHVENVKVQRPPPPRALQLNIDGSMDIRKGATLEEIAQEERTRRQVVCAPA